MTEVVDPNAADGRLLDTHFEWALDDPAELARPMAYVDAVSPADRDERRPIVPPSLKAGNLKATAKLAAGRNGHRLGFHGVRLPWYALLAMFWAVVGAGRIVNKQIRWWWLMEQHHLRQSAASNDDHEAWDKLHRAALKVRSWRGMVLGAQLLAVAAVVVTAYLVDRWWLTAGLLMVAVPFLAHHGRPADKPIVRPAVVIPRFRILTADIVLRAYYAARLGDPDKAPVQFGAPMARDGDGSRVLVDLPYGKSFSDAIKARAAIASGLDVSESQVFISRDPSSTRRHLLWVADRDPLAIPAGRTPLLRLRPTDIWAPAPFGLDERGRPVSIDLMWNSLLVGAQPRKGKTFAARLLALYASLDPYVKLTIIDGKKSPDWRSFNLVADRIVRGTTPMPGTGDQIELLIDTLQEIKRDIEHRNDRLSHLPVTVCPEGKLTRDIARDPRYGMPVRLVVLEEFQVYFELPDQELNKTIAGLLTYLGSVGPSAGVILLSSTQKPSGVGSGDVQRLFNRYRDNHQVRFALRCGNRDVSIAVLGGEAYAEGFDASALPLGDAYRGVGILYGDRDHPPTVRTHLADGADAEKILVAARAARERAGTLSGMAAGEEVEVDKRDVLADVRSVFYAGEAFISWQAIAARLQRTQPEAYDNVTPEWISAAVRAFGVPSDDGRCPDFEGRTLKGSKLEAVDAAMHRRAIEAGR